MVLAGGIEPLPDVDRTSGTNQVPQTDKHWCQTEDSNLRWDPYERSVITRSFGMVGPVGLEPTSVGLKVRHSIPIELETHEQRLRSTGVADLTRPPQSCRAPLLFTLEGCSVPSLTRFSDTAEDEVVETHSRGASYFRGSADIPCRFIFHDSERQQKERYSPALASSPRSGAVSIRNPSFRTIRFQGGVGKPSRLQLHWSETHHSVVES